MQQIASEIIEFFFSICDCFVISIDFLTNIADIVEFWLKLFFEIFVFLIKLIFYEYEKNSLIVNEESTRWDWELKFISPNQIIEKWQLIFIVLILSVLTVSILYLKVKIKRLERSNLMLKQSCSSQNCVICLQEKSSILLMPCKHLCCCEKCLDLMKENVNNLNCPLCRTQIQSEIKIFV